MYSHGIQWCEDAVQLARRAARANLPEPFFSRFRADVLDFRDAASLATVAEKPPGVDTVLISGQLYEGALSVPLLHALQTLCSRKLCTILMVFWISIEFSKTQIAFLDRMSQVGFKVVDDFACRERGYANPGCLLPGANEETMPTVSSEGAGGERPWSRMPRRRGALTAGSMKKA
eukprot:s2600_g12.t1